MIERVKIGGRDAYAAYLSAEMEPRGRDDAELVKITFDDGEVTFARMASDDGKKRRADAAVGAASDAVREVKIQRAVADAFRSATPVPARRASRPSGRWPRPTAPATGTA